MHLIPVCTLDHLNDSMISPQAVVKTLMISANGVGLFIQQTQRAHVQALKDEMDDVLIVIRFILFIGIGDQVIVMCGPMG